MRSLNVWLIRRLITAPCTALLIVCTNPSAAAENWAATFTKAYPVQYLQNPVAIGALDPSTAMHIVVGLQERNAGLVQSILRGMLTVGNPLYGTTYTVQQFVAQFGPTTQQVQAVENYLQSEGFTNATVADNRLLIEADGTAAQVQTAFNTTLEQYSANGAVVYVNTAPAQVPASLSGIVIAVLGLNNVAMLHPDLHRVQTGPQTDPCTTCAAPDLDNETFTPQQYQIAYDAACPADNPSCPAKGFPTGSDTVVGVIAEGDLTQVVKDLRTYETTYGLPEVPVTVVNAGIASSDTSGEDEWDLDSQTSTGIAE
jgi:subtilase family serine protease